jgi:hypothetical protein
MMLLAQPDNNGRVCLSSNVILQELSMINSNYAFCKNNAPALSSFINIPLFNVYDFYNHTHSTIKSALETALNQLQKQSLIFWNKIITVCVEDDKGKNYRDATKDEIKLILKIERDVMDELDIDNKQELIMRGIWDIFADQVTNILHRESNILYYYNSYNIINNKEHILKALKKMESKALKKELNEKIQIKLEANTINRQKKAYSFTIKPVTNILEKMKPTYVTQNKQLIDTLIDSNSPNIINDICQHIYNSKDGTSNPLR